MKKIITAICLGVYGITCAQTIINADATTAKTTVSSPSVLLEFGNDNNKGIILPYVESVPTAVGGTLIFDVSETGEYKVKVKNTTAGWTDLSGQSGYSTAVENEIKTPQSTPLADNSTAKAIIGATSSTADGILVLESNTKAMVLPKVSNVNNIPSPSPGMMVFVEGATADAHRLASFNGSTWAFWKP